jgi:hypothetical protein
MTKEKPPTFTYDNETFFQVQSLLRSKYDSNGALAIIAVVSILEQGEIVDSERMTVSINFDHDSNDHASSHLQPGEFIAKDYAEAEKIFNALGAAGWLEPTGVTFRSGFVECPVCRLTELGLANSREQ